MTLRASCRNIITLLLCCCCYFHISNQTSASAPVDNISWGQSLSGNKTLISRQGIFELGFFMPGKSQNSYIGIWFKNRPDKTVVWVANREAPIADASSSELKIFHDGNLVLLNQAKNIIWTTNLEFAQPNKTKAVLLDTGNLVLENISDSSRLLWESFDYPTDSWLPGGRFGWNNRIKQFWNVTSWKSPDDPAPGHYSFGVDPESGNQLIQAWNGTNIYWNSGAWNGRYFALVPEMVRNPLFNYTYVESERYMTYSLTQPSNFTSFVMNITGEGVQIGLLSISNGWVIGWVQPSIRCQVYLHCGPFSICTDSGTPLCSCLPGFEPVSKDDWDSQYWNDGCKRRTQLRCSKGSASEADGFLTIPNIQMPDDSETTAYGSIIKCNDACLQNCYCLAYAFNDGICLMWKSKLINLRQNSKNPGNGTGSIYIRLSASELHALTPSSKSRKGAKRGVLIVAVGAFVVVMTLVAFLVWKRQGRPESSISRKARERSLVVFTFREIQILTKNFSEKLGAGGFGSVYKGLLPGAVPIAVKKLEGQKQGEKQFRAEVSTIATIQHVNLVRLRGFCCEGDKRLLVYDYMKNGSLDSYLFRDNSEPLEWGKRYLIAIGTARALAYLHEGCRDCILHCDIKPENVLLDEEFHPKVADFGMAKLMGREVSKVLTTMRGTVGYLAPEWLSGLPITTKVDVYSFGMMLFELVSGRRNATQDLNGSITFFPILVAMKIAERDIANLVDRRLEGDFNMEELQQVCKVAVWCIQDSEAQRPAMGQIVQMLEGMMEVNVPPIPSYLQNLVDPQLM